MELHPDVITSQFLSSKLLPRNTVVQLLTKTMHLLTSEPNICTTSSHHRRRFNIVGDLHGQFYDLQHGVFKACGNPSPSNGYCFNGDFVDRGSWSIEVWLTLLAWKLKYPDDVFLTRGNHESRAMTTRYGFKDECIFKYDIEIYELCLQTFSCLPLGLVLDNHTLVIHGGLSSGTVTINDMQLINRFMEPPHKKGDLMMHTLWSDPSDDVLGISRGHRGGNTILFGSDVTDMFCKINKLKRVIRSHQVKERGLSSQHAGKLFTVFSAPNYVDKGGNLGAVVIFEQDKMGFVQFKHSAHPDIEPMMYMKMRRSRL